MAINSARLSEDILRTAVDAAGVLTVTFEVGPWADGEIRSVVDSVLDGLKSHKIRLKGIRTDVFGFQQFGIAMDRANSGKYNDVPIVIDPAKPFDTVELVFQPAP